MRSFFRLIVGIFVLLSLVATMILTTIVFLFLRPKFYISSLAKPGVYKNIEKGLKTSARESLRTQLAGRGINYGDLSVGERKAIDSQIDKLLSPINEKNIQDFSENNIINILNFINGKDERFIFYLPLSRWNLPEQSLQSIPDFLKTTNIDVFKLKEEHPEINLNVTRLALLKDMGSKIRIYWVTAIVLTFIFILIHLSLGERMFRNVKTGRLITGSGILFLFLAWVIKIFQNTFGQNIAVRSQAPDILIGTILSVLLESVYKLWLVAGIILIVIGLILFNIKPRGLKTKT